MPKIEADSLHDLFDEGRGVWKEMKCRKLNRPKKQSVPVASLATEGNPRELKRAMLMAGTLPSIPVRSIPIGWAGADHPSKSSGNSVSNVWAIVQILSGSVKLLIASVIHFVLGKTRIEPERDILQDG